MFTNVAYLHNSLADMVDTSRSLVVTSCGYYRVHSRLLFPRSDSTDERIISFYTLQRAKVIFILTDHSDKKPLLLKEI